MITPNMIYWITRLDSFNLIVSIAMAMITVIMTCSGTVTAMMNIEEHSSFNARICKKARTYFIASFIASFIACVLCGIILVLTPTTKEAAAMYVIPKIANNKKIQNIGDKMADLANAWIDELSPRPIKPKNDK